jgi:hypothetical protein
MLGAGAALCQQHLGIFQQVLGSCPGFIQQLLGLGLGFSHQGLGLLLDVSHEVAEPALHGTQPNSKPVAGSGSNR